jgi:hypothetical protein
MFVNFVEKTHNIVTKSVDAFNDIVPPLLHSSPSLTRFHDVCASTNSYPAFRALCGRYRRTTQEEELARLYNIPIPKRTDYPSVTISPLAKRF